MVNRIMFKKIKKIIKDPWHIVKALDDRKMLHFLPDKAYLKLYYRSVFKKKLDLKNPKTFNEKLQWLKLYDRKPEYTMMVDKYEVKKYIAETIGEEYVIPTLGVWDRFEDIDFDKLPNQFVLKCTHDSGGLVICRDKSKLDIDKAKKKIKKSLKRNYYWSGREWPYKNVKPRIIAEKYMEDTRVGELPDYKFFCFNGKCKMMFIATNRSKGSDEIKFDFFDEKFNKLPFTQGHPNSDVLSSKPEKFYEMIELAEKLSQGVKQVRIDFYEVNGKIYFGEYTLFHYSGFTPIYPNEWDEKLGKLINIT